MKIYYIAKFKKLWDEESIARGFEDNGHTVIRADDSSKTNKEYLEEIQKEKPDLVLFAKLHTKENPQVLLDEIKKLGVSTVSWTFDLLLGHPPREKVISSFHFLKADYVFLTDGGHTKEYKEIGINKHTCRQAIPDEYYYQGEYTPEYDYDIVFIGTQNVTFPYRQKTMRFLEDIYGDRFHWIGKENDQAIRGHDLNKLYASCKIVIGDYMYSPNYWSNRIYETLGRGAFLITPRIAGLDEHYTEYKDYIPYDWGDYEQLKKKIDYFLEHPADRKKIQDQAFKTSAKHTWKTRCKQFIELYEKASK